MQGLAGCTVIVTGANTGLGFEAAKHFYAMNPERLILAVRRVSKGEESQKHILEEKRGATKVEVWELDLMKFESVKVFANRAKRELEKVDVLLENAGVQFNAWATARDRCETMYVFFYNASLRPTIPSTKAPSQRIVDVLARRSNDATAEEGG